MEKTFDIGEKLFFKILIICLVSFIYFKTVPMNTLTYGIGILIGISHLGINFYIGYKYNLKIVQSIIVGIMGCGVGIFLLFFSLYTYIILDLPHNALWIAMPYALPTISLVDLLQKDLSIIYIIQLMLINILLVVIGSFSRRLMNKLTH